MQDFLFEIGKCKILYSDFLCNESQTFVDNRHLYVHKICPLMSKLLFSPTYTVIACIGLYKMANACHQDSTPFFQQSNMVCSLWICLYMTD